MYTQREFYLLVLFSKDILALIIYISFKSLAPGKVCNLKNLNLINKIVCKHNSTNMDSNKLWNYLVTFVNNSGKKSEHGIGIG